MNIILQPDCDGHSLRIQAIQTLLKNHEYLLAFIFKSDLKTLRSDPSDLICAAGGYSHGEIILILIALDIWCGEGSVTINETLRILDESNWRQFVKSLAVLSRVYGD